MKLRQIPVPGRTITMGGGFHSILHMRKARGKRVYLSRTSHGIRRYRVWTLDRKGRPMKGPGVYSYLTLESALAKFGRFFAWEK